MRKKSNIHPFLKMAGVKSEKEFYKKFPSDEEFFAAYPQARYGMRIADDGTGMLPIGPLVPLGTTPPAQRTMTTVPVPPMGKYVIPKDGEEDDDEEETPDQETPEQQQAKKQRKKYKLNVNAGDKTWSPFAKDNAWNTGQGVKTTDLFGTTAALASSVLPYQPARMNKPLLPLAIGSYGTGSHAAFEDGGNLPNKSTITGKTKMRNSTVPKDSRYESGFVTVNEYPNKINDTSYSYMSGQPGMEQNMFYNTQIDPATGKAINTLSRNGMISTIPQDSINYYKNKISNLAGFADGGYINQLGYRTQEKSPIDSMKSLFVNMRDYNLYSTPDEALAKRSGYPYEKVGNEFHVEVPKSQEQIKNFGKPKYETLPGLPKSGNMQIEQFAYGGELSPTKARMMLHDGTVHGKPITDKQRRYFGAVASGYAEDGIHIDPSKKGTFTAAATKHGKSVQAFASQVLANKEDYSPAMVKKANFAKNAAKWKKADGGKIHLNLPEKQQEEEQRMKMGGFGFAGDNNFMLGIKPTYQTDRLSVSPYVTGGVNQNFQKIPTDYGIEGSYQLNDKLNLNANIGKSKTELGLTYNFADGGPMITHVEPSAHTYFRPMTRQGRQVPETPNFIAADGMTMQPITDADRQAYNNYIHGMRKLPGYDAVDWQHDQTFQKNAAQQLGFDYSKAAAIQADMMARNEMYPGSIKGIQGSDPWGGKPGWIGDRERQKEYVKYQYTAETQNPQTGVMKEYYNSGAPQFTPMTDQQFRSEVERARGNFNTQSNLPPTTNPMDPAYVAPSVPQSGPKAIGLAATGIPTRDEAIANYQARKASGQELPSNYFQEDTKKQKRMKETGDPIGMVRLTGEDVYAYGGPILGGFDARLNQNFPYPMTNQYPHKIGGQYHPYDHTRMEMGGPIPFANGGEAGTDIQVDGNKFKMLSPFTAEIGGQYHSNGGTDIMSNGQQVEAEKKETLHIQPDGTAIVGGNLYVPGTNTKFKDAFKDVAKAEKKTGKVQDKASKFLNEYGSEGIGAKNRYQSPAFNYGVVMSDAYEQKKANDEAVKNSLTEIQNKMLELGGMIDPENGAKKVSGMFKGKAKWGTQMAKKGKVLKKFNPMANAVQFDAPTSSPGILQSTTEPVNIQYPSDQAPQSLLIPDNQMSSSDPNDFADDAHYMRRAKRENPTWIKMQEEEGGLSPDSPISKTAITNFPGESGIAKAIAVDKQDKEFIKSLGKDTSKENDKKKVQGLRNKFRITDYIPEIVAGFERADPYQSMQVQPYLESEYNVSFQNEKNAIQSAFGPAMKAARTAGERATIAAQMAEQLANVDAKEFQFNQQNVGGIRGRNLQEMRGVRDTNLKLGMDAYEKTLAGKEAARQIRQAAGRSVSAKEAARRAKNLELGMYEDYAGWAYNPETKKKWEMLHPGQTYDPRTVSLADFYDDDEKKTTKKKKKDSKGKESEEETVTTTENKKYYGGPMAYFGEYMPIAPVRTYIAGGAVGGGIGMGMGMGMSHSAPGGMHGLPGQQGSMASRYSPGGDSSYYQKKKRKRKSN